MTKNQKTLTRLSLLGLWCVLVAGSCEPQEPPNDSELDNHILPPAPVGELPATFAVSAAGSATYAIPLDVPPGRASLAPQLAINYSSSASRGNAGVGWTLSADSRIHRCNDNLNHDGRVRPARLTSDPFTCTNEGCSALCLDGTRLIRDPSQSNAYRPENAPLVRVVRNSDRTFSVELPSGITDRYATTTTATRSVLGSAGTATTTQQVAVAWHRSERVDQNGNYVTFSHQTGSGSCVDTRLTEIAYTGHRGGGVSVGTNRRVEFRYVTQPSGSVSYFDGVCFAPSAEISRVVMHGPNENGLIAERWNYQLGYRQSLSTGRRLLESVTKCSMGVCLPATEFDYSEQPEGYVLSNTGNTGYADVLDNAVSSAMAIELDDDGRTELLYRDRTNWYVARTDQGSLPLRNAEHLGLPYLNVAQVPLAFDAENDGRMEFVAATFEADIDVFGSLRAFNLIGNTAVVRNDMNYPGGANLIPNAPIIQVPHYIGPFISADLSGDGWADMLQSVFLENYLIATGEPHPNPHEPINHPVFRFANGRGTFGPLQISQGARLVQSSRYVPAELDGDAGMEMILEFSTVQGSSSAVNALDMTPRGGVQLQPLNLGTDSSAFVIDANGDGLSDICYDQVQSGNTLGCRLNTGAGFGPTQNMTAPGSDYAQGDHEPDVSSPGIRVLDYNGDGRPDFTNFEGGQGTVYVSTDRGFVAHFLEGLVRYPHTRNEGYEHVQVGDFDGDGADDIALSGKVTQQTDYRLLVHRRRVSPEGLQGDRIVAIRTGFGTETEIDYETLGTHHNGVDRVVYDEEPTYAEEVDCVFPERCVRRGPVLVSEYRVVGIPAAGDREAVWRRYEMTYRAGREDPTGDGFLGFQEVETREEVEDEWRKTTTVVYDLRRATNGSHPFVGSPVRTLTNTNVGEESREFVDVSIEYDLFQWRNTRSAEPRVRVRRETTYGYDSGNGIIASDSTVTNSNMNAFGAWQHTEVAVSPRGRQEVISRTFENRTSAHVFNLLRSETVVSQGDVFSDVAERTSRQTFDTVGNLQTRIDWARSQLPTTFVVTKRNAFGQPTSVEQQGSGEVRVVEIEFDNLDSTFVETAENALGHRTRTVTHPSFGFPILSYDANGARSETDFDAFGRVVAVRLPNGYHGEVEYQVPSSTDDEGVVLVTLASDNAGAETRTALNFRGQPLSDAVRMFDGRTAVSSYVYDELGRMTGVRRPHWSTEDGSASDDATITSVYDGLGRVVLETSPRGQRSFYYATPSGGGHLSRVTDEEGRINQAVYDGSGRLRAAANMTPGADRELVEYTYGPNSRLAQVSRSGLLTTFQYDERSLTRSYVSPDDEVSRIEYNAFGDVVETETSARGVLTLSYDVLGRLEGRTSRDGISTLRYDEGEFGLGRLTSTMSEDGVATVHTYTASGQIASEVAVVGGEVLETSFEYDDVGRLQLQHFPDSAPGRPFSVGYHYNAAGYLDRLSNGPSGQTLFDVAEANELGQPTRVAMGAGTAEYGWDVDRGELDSLSFSQSGVRRFRHDYEYNDAGQVIGRESVFGLELREDRFEYDENRRLASWRQAWGEEHNTRFHSAEYDEHGNLTRMGRRDFTVGGEGYSPHQVSSIDGDGRMRYDDDGRLIERGDLGFEYTHFDLPRRITGLSGSTDFSYDASGRKSLRINAASSTIYLGEAYERQTAADGSQRHTYHVAGLLDVVREEETPGGFATERHLYRHSDPVGSVVAVTDGNGNVVERRDYSPFGDTDEGVPGVLRTFAGHPIDDDGVVFMRGRVYDPESMRFQTPDPIVADPTLGDDFNPYRYVRNDPVSQNDPSGFGDVVVPEPRGHARNIRDGLRNHDFYHTNEQGAGQGQGASDEGEPGAGAASGSSSTQGGTTGPSLSISLDPRAPGGATLMDQNGTPLADPDRGNTARVTNGGPKDRSGGGSGPAFGGFFGDDVTEWHDLFPTGNDGWLARASNFSAGAGDALSFGLGGLARSALGLSDQVDTESGSYLTGTAAATIATVVTGPGAARGAAQGLAGLAGRVRALRSFGLDQAARRAFLGGEMVVFQQASGVIGFARMQGGRLVTGVFSINAPGQGVRLLSGFRSQSTALGRILGATELELAGAEFTNAALRAMLARSGFVPGVMEAPAALGGGAMNVLSRMIRL